MDLAVCAGHPEVVRLLSAAGADPSAAAGEYDEATPPLLAAMRGDTAVARLLLDAGVDPGGPRPAARRWRWGTADRARRHRHRADAARGA
ncbi:hypothetical protein [Streptomyces subrutilus]|uniref:hypothetical protein n=1 Tax=Streptomyces subrutilus TaxID=36818 RepID=UPI003267118C